MNSEPNYLDLDEQLYPQITLHKQIIISNDGDGFYQQIFARVAYDCSARKIDLTESVSTLLTKSYEQSVEFKIFIRDEQINQYVSIGYYPAENPIRVGEQFLQNEILLIKIKPFEEVIAEPSGEIQIAIPENSENKQEAEEGNGAAQENNAKDIKTRRRTIKQILLRAQEWRKLYLSSGCKISLQQAADIMGMTRRSLQDYIGLIKLGQKYNFPFQAKLNEKVNELRKFVKDNHFSKKEQELQILSKFKANYK